MHFSRNTSSPSSSASTEETHAAPPHSALRDSTGTESPEAGKEAPRASPLAAGILADSWPTLARALGRYEQNTAERFTRLAYDLVRAGIIRQSDRARLAAAAEELSLRPFDAQLLIACAIRQWALDRRYDASPSPHAPALSFEYKAWSRLWVRLALVFCTAAILDGIILWKWLS